MAIRNTRTGGARKRVAGEKSKGGVSPKPIARFKVVSKPAVKPVGKKGGNGTGSRGVDVDGTLEQISKKPISKPATKPSALAQSQARRAAIKLAKPVKKPMS
jgi:hypothetical protein